MKIDLNSKLIPNVQIYVVNGNWSGVLLEDCVTRELLFHIFDEGQTKATTRRIDRDQTFDQYIYFFLRTSILEVFYIYIEKIFILLRKFLYLLYQRRHS